MFFFLKLFMQKTSSSDILNFSYGKLNTDDIVNVRLVFMFNSLPQKNKFLKCFKLKAFADDNFNVIQMMIYVLNRVKNILGKRENAGNQHFLLLLQCFIQPFYRSLKLHGKGFLETVETALYLK